MNENSTAAIKNLHATQEEITVLQHEAKKLERDLKSDQRDTIYADLLLFRNAIKNAEQQRYNTLKNIASRYKSDTTSKWRSMDDSLPDDGTEVLFAFRTKNSEQYTVMTDYFYNDEDRYSHDCYWMPLPSTEELEAISS